jgi:hypothetical protein
MFHLFSPSTEQRTFQTARTPSGYESQLRQTLSRLLMTGGNETD